MLTKPIFILGCHKSGTTLVRNLLDGAPNIFALPIETHFFQHLGMWVSYDLGYSHPKKLSFTEVVNHLYTEIQESNTKPSYQQKWGDSFIPGKWDTTVFLKYLQEHGRIHYDSNNLKDFFNCFVEATYLSLYGNTPQPNTRFVEKSVENAEFVPLIKNWYPEAKFIHIVRNPYATLVALRKFKTLVRDHYPFIGPLVQSIENSYYYLYKNQTYISDYLVVRFEDLLSDPHAVMHKITTFCEIEFNEVIFRPTYLNGKDWSGNSMSGKEFKGISTHPIDSWKKEVSNMEISFVNQWFSHILQDYNYEKIKNIGSIWRKNKKERLQYYIANRFYLKSIGYIRQINKKLLNERYAKHSGDW